MATGWHRTEGKDAAQQDDDEEGDGDEEEGERQHDDEGLGDGDEESRVVVSGDGDGKDDEDGKLQPEKEKLDRLCDEGDRREVAVDGKKVRGTAPPARGTAACSKGSGGGEGERLPLIK